MLMELFNNINIIITIAPANIIDFLTVQPCIKFVFEIL